MKKLSILLLLALSLAGYSQTAPVGRITGAGLASDVATNTAAIALTNSNLSAKKGILGDIYNLTLAAGSSSLYTDTSPQTVFTFTSGGITATTGNNDPLNFLEYTSYYTNAAYYTRKIRFTVTSDGDGIGIGLHSSNGDILARIINTTAGNRGKVLIDIYRSPTQTNRATSTAALTYTNGHVIELTFERSLTNYRVTAQNITTSTSTSPVLVSVEYNDPLTYPNGNTWAGGRSAIYHFGGSQTITQDAYTVNDYTGNEVLVYGNSIWAGFYAGSSDMMAFNTLKQALPAGATLVSGGGNRSSDYANLKAEILALKPRIAVWTDGINDIINGVSAATTQTNILGFLADCKTAGIIPILCEVLPISSTYTPPSGTNASVQTAINTLNTWMNNLGTVKVVATNAPLLSAGSLSSFYDAGDGLHLNGLGNRAIATAVLTTINTVSVIAPQLQAKATAFGSDMTNDVNNAAIWNFRNPNAGSTSSVSMRFTSDVAQGGLLTYGSTNTVIGIANYTLLSNNASGLALAAYGASGNIRFSTAALNFSTNLRLTIGTTIDAVVPVTNTLATNAAYTGYTVTNSNSGSSAIARYLAIADVSNIGLTALSSAYSSVNTIFAASDIAVNGSSTTNLLLVNTGTGGIKFGTGGAFAANVRGNIGGTTGNWRIGDATAAAASALLDVASTTKGFLPPRMTTTQKNAISSPAEGLCVYDTDLHKLYVFDGTTWQAAW
jgi:lysophospholipase L1-like esterase